MSIISKLILVFPKADKIEYIPWNDKQKEIRLQKRPIYLFRGNITCSINFHALSGFRLLLMLIYLAARHPPAVS